MIKTAYYLFNMGSIKIVYEDDTVISLKRYDKSINIEEESQTCDFSNKVMRELLEYFHGDRKVFSFKFEPREGTEFQRKVWEELSRIPYGETRSYKDIAIAIGNPKGSRAIGLANSKNPLPFVVPCHRVIGSSGKLTGYAEGLDMKEFLLDLEKNNK